MKENDLKSFKFRGVALRTHPLSPGRETGLPSAHNASNIKAQTNAQPALIRAMTEGDVKAVMPIEIASFEDPWTPLAFLADLQHNPCASYLVAYDEGQNVIGYIGWWRKPESVHIMRLAVSIDARRMGLGRALVGRAFVDAAECGKHFVQLDVRARNVIARKFYETLGFQEVETVAGYYGNDDAVRMAAPAQQP